MQRRTVIKQLSFAAGAVLLLPSCLQDKKGASSVLLKNIKIDAGQEKMLSALCQALIPTTDTPGASEVGAYPFVLTMVDDCYVAADQQDFIKGLKAFDESVKKKFDKSFAECSPQQRQEFLQTLEANKNSRDALTYFYETAKKLCIQAYTSSEYFLTKVQVYELMPGHFYGCVPVKKAS